ncbi:unnamed protein product [Closterium sp. NIES-64]|nr:unnamed protein product [Closterium sp. NIES-64]
MIAFAQTCLAREGSDDGEKSLFSAHLLCLDHGRLRQGSRSIGGEIAAAAQEALRVVEHGASMLRAQGGQAAASQAARLLRFKAALHLRVHDSTGAVEALEEVAAMGDAGLCDRGHTGASGQGRKGKQPSGIAVATGKIQRPLTMHMPWTSAAPPGLAFLRFRVLCSVGLVEQLCGHIATAREHFQEADELEPPDCNSVPTTGLARLAMALHLHSVGQWEQATSYYSQLIQCSSPPSPPSSSPPSSSSSPSSPSIASPSPTASSLSPSLRAGAAERVGALSGRGQLLLQQGDFKAAEEQFTTALKEAEAMDDSSDFNPMMGAVLSLLGDTYAQRGRLQHTGEGMIAEVCTGSTGRFASCAVGVHRVNCMLIAAPVLALLGDSYAQRGRLQHTGEGMIAEGLFRRALALLGGAQWDSLDHRLSLLAGAASGSTAAEDADEEQLKDRKNRVLQLDLIAFTLGEYAPPFLFPLHQELYAAALQAFPMRTSEAQSMKRYAAALQAFPMRASEAQSMSAAAHHLWRSSLSLDSAVTSSRVSAAAFEPMMKSSVCAADNPGWVGAAHLLSPAAAVDVNNWQDAVVMR